MRAAAIAGTLMLSLMGGACLEGGAYGGLVGQVDAGGQPDAAPADQGVTKRQPDVAPDVGPPPADVIGPPPSCPFTCDDGNPCTTDGCDEATGECTHTPAPEGTVCGDGCGTCWGGWCQWPAAEPPECWDDAACDDGDPCTQDVCVVEADACYSWAWCEHIALDGCGVTCPDSCDDGDPCTEDWCDISGACVNEPMWECAEVPTCSGAGATTISDVLWSGMSGQLVKVAAMPVPGAMAWCDDSVCGECGGEMWLVDPDAWMGELVAAPGATGLGDFSCWSGGCPTTTACSPMQHKARYWVWGVAEEILGPGYAPTPDGGGNGDIAYYPMRLNVEGYCLQTTPAGLPGQYVGQLEHYYGYTTEVTMTINHLPSGYQITLSELTCPWCVTSADAQDATHVGVGDGWLSFGAVVPDGGDLIGSTFDLVSDGNALRGEFWADGTFPMGGDSDGVMMPPGGTLRVTRVP